MSGSSELVILSNRLPVQRSRRPGGGWEISPGGLVSALTPILEKRPSTWIGWAGVPGPAPGAFEHAGIQNLPIPLSRAEVEGFYEGFSNRTLWPLYHDALRPPEFDRSWWQPYVEVNRRFAAAAARTARPRGMVWVHDYHLQLAPQMIRELRPDLRIGFFLHIPFPPRELFARLPWRRQLLEGLLGADVVGLQTLGGAQNVADVARRFAGASGRRDALLVGDRTVRVDAFPISIDIQRFENLAARKSVVRRAATVREQLGSPDRILLGVDRLDYTKGIELRLEAFRTLLRTGTVGKGCVLVQVAVPSRERVQQYRALRSQVEQLVGQINGEYSDVDYTPVHYFHRTLAPEELTALYLAADVMLVTPLRDGMNLVAKEYVACHRDERGVLLLSEFTGAALELRGALLVNPHDIDGLALALLVATRMSDRDQRRRMRILRRMLQRNDVYGWADSFLAALAR